jgi:RNA polymerase sigma factor (sigma-70 family)
MGLRALVRDPVTPARRDMNDHLISVPDQSHDAAPSAESTANRSAAMQALVDNHRTFLRFLERRVGNRDTAEDLLQDAFGRAIEHLDELRENESIVAWFYRVLRNAVIDHYRRSDAAHRAAAAFARDFEEAVPPHDVHDAICACISDLARTLKPEYAEALRQIDVEGVPVKEFAERSGISAGNAGVRVFRAREALRRQVVASCGTCAEHGCVDCRCGRPR